MFESSLVKRINIRKILVWRRIKILRSGVPCMTCGSGGLPVFADRNLDEMIENFVEVGYLYRDYPNLWEKLLNGAEHSLPAMREGTQHTLKTIRQNPSKYAPHKIEAMDLRFEELPGGIDLCPNCRYDIKFKSSAVGGDIPLYAEFKSYSLSTWNNISKSSQFFNQFKNYIASINSMDELAYVINVSKASVDDVKFAFKTMLSNPTKKTEIFEVMNENLKFSLQIDDVADLTSSKIDEILNIIIKVQ